MKATNFASKQAAILLSIFALNACFDSDSATGNVPADSDTAMECTAKKIEGGSDFEFICNGTVVGSIGNLAESSCKFEELGDSTGYEIICGSDTVGTFYGSLADTIPTTDSTTANPAKCSEGDLFLQATPAKKYVCFHEIWKAADSLDVLTIWAYDTYGIACNDSNKGEIIQGKISGLDKVCKSSGWASPNQADYAMEGQKCTAENEGKIEESKISEEYYKCENGSWIQSYRLDYDTQDKTCDESNEGEIIEVNHYKSYVHYITSTNYYKCSQNNWQYLSLLERDIYEGMICDSSNIGKMEIGPYSNIAYVCQKNGWEELVSEMSWYGNDSEFRVKTEYNQYSENAGGWFVYSDSSLGGNSRIKWPVETGNEYDDKALDPVIEHCNGLCGEFVLGDSLHFNDSSYQKPFIGVGFNVTDSDTVGGDITGWGGISIAYSGPAAIIELVPENEKNYLESDNYFANIPRQGSINAIKISWNDFNSWASLDSQTEVPLNEFLKKVVAIRIYTQLEPGSIESFKIMAIGSYNTPVYY